MIRPDRRRIARAAAGVLLVAACAFPAVGAAGPVRAAPTDSAEIAWLRDVATAPERLNYEGTKTVTVWGGSQVRASQVRVYHLAPDRTRLEYLAAGDQPERIVVITGDRQIVYVPSRNKVVERPAVHTDEDLLARQVLPQMVANYDVRFTGTDRVAERITYVVEIRGRQPGRPSLRLWVDAATRLILRSERYGPQGALRESSVFLTLRLNPPLAADLFVIAPRPGMQFETRSGAQFAPPPGSSPPSPGGSQLLPGGNPPLPGGGSPPPRGPVSMPIEEIARRVGFIPQLPQYLPPGYQFVRSGVVVVRGVPTAAFTFSDGVSTMTLFESRGPEGQPANARRVQIGPFQGSATSRGVATVLHWNARGISFILVGDLAQDELIRVGSSVPPVGSSFEPTPGPGGRLARMFALPAAEAAAPPPPVSPYITNDTHPIGPGIRQEEVPIWEALASRGLTPIVVKVTVASDGVTHLADGRLARLAWIWFVYGMDRPAGGGGLLAEVRDRARALAATTFAADPRVDRVTLTGYYHVRGRFDGRRVDATFTADLGRALLQTSARMDAGSALARAGRVWYDPGLESGAVVMRLSRTHDPHMPRGTPAPAQPGDRTVESAERFSGTVAGRIVETKERLDGLLFGVPSRGRLWRGNPLRRQVALTFDDGPSPVATPLLLAILKRYGAHATFFVIGEHARAYPYLLAQMAADGHEIGDHTYHHPNLVTLGDGDVAAEIRAAAAVIRDATGRPPRWFRPPGGNYTVAAAAAAHDAGMALAMWTQNSGDWALPPPKVIVERVMLRAQPGAIILMHNGTLNTVRALPSLLAALERRGYTAVTLSDLTRETE